MTTLGNVEVDDDVERRHLSVDGPNGRVPGRLTTTVGLAADAPLLLLGHGGGGGKDEGFMPRLAARYTRELGVAVLAIDGPVHGERAPEEGTPADRFRAARRALVDPDGPDKFAEDWRVSIAAARTGGAGRGPLLYVGFSMGTMYGVPVVAALGDVRGAVFGVGGVPRPGGVADLVRGIAGDAAAAIVEEEDDAGLRGRLALEAAAKLHSTEVLMLNMTKDVVFPIEGGLELFAAFPGPKRMGVWEGGHTELPAEALALSVTFLRRVITGEPAGHRSEGTW